VIGLPEQFRQPRDVDGYPAGLVLLQHLCLPRFGLVVAGVDVGERLPVGVPDDVPLFASNPFDLVPGSGAVVRAWRCRSRRTA
jgi:hypothetical protein